VNDYILETPVGSVTMVADDDLTAAANAVAYFKRSGYRKTCENLFRVPACCPNRSTSGLIWVPVFRFL